MTSQNTPRVTVFVDADNTLWDTDSVFAGAQLGLLANVEAAIDIMTPSGDRLAFVRAIDQAIAGRHHAGLRYPPRLLADEVAVALAGFSAKCAAKAAWSGGQDDRLSDEIGAGIEQAFFAAISRLPVLRPGVLEGLQGLEAAGCITLIVTEGARARVEATATKLGLRGHFTRIIEGPKRPELYRRVLRLSGAPVRAFMIGDQLDRDIAPAKAAGLETIYFPGGFRPRWALEEDAVRPDHRIECFAEVPSIVLGDRVPVAARAAR